MDQGASPDGAGWIARGQVGELFYHVSDAVAIVDASWRLRHWNPAGERLLGYTEERLLGQPFSSLFPDATEFARVQRFLQESRQPGNPQASESCRARLRTQAGRLISARCQLVGLASSPGSTDSQAVLIQEDPGNELGVTGAALARQLSQLAETAGVVTETDITRVAQSMTDLAKELIGADFTGLLLADALPDGTFSVKSFTYNAPRHLFPEQYPRPIGLLGSALRTRSVLRIDDIRGHRDGVGIPVQHPPVGALLAVPLMVGDRLLGELLAANRVGRPVFTELDEILLTHLGSIVKAALESARLQGELAAKADQLDMLNRRRRETIAAIAHDLRTPAAAVLGYGELAGDPALPPEKRDLVLTRLAGQARQLNRMVDDLSMASQLDTQKLSVAVAPLAVNAMLEELRSDYRLRFPDRPIEITGEPVPPLMADAERLRQVLTNLLDNAIKYSETSSPIEVELHTDGRRVVLGVCDHGQGIDAQDLPHLFEPFYRSRTLPKNIPGIGLGLTIVKGLVEAMGGAISVETNAGLGSCFWISLNAA